MLRGPGYEANDKYVKQLMFADGKLGEIIKKLKDNDQYDKSLIIITLDHDKIRDESGRRRKSIPLFIKVPFQKSQHHVTKKVYTLNFKKFLSSFLESNAVDIKKLE